MLIDDHPLFRHALKDALESEPGLTVVAEAGSGTEALDLIHSTSPDIALVDLRLPDIDGLDLCERIVEGSTSRCIVLTSSPFSKELFQRARAMGADALVIKGSDLSGLITSVREVANGTGRSDSHVSFGVPGYLGGGYRRFYPSPSDPRRIGLEGSAAGPSLERSETQMSSEYLKVHRNTGNGVQIGFMLVDASVVYLDAPTSRPGSAQGHYAYATQEVAFSDGWVIEATAADRSSVATDKN